MEKLKVYEALARAFAAEGTDTVFGLMGDGNMLWTAAMAQIDGVRVIHARHENAAVAMADGYAQVKGDVGVCSVTCGPGITQIPTSLTGAVRDHTPMVIFAGDTPRRAAYHLQEFDPGPLIAATGAAHVRLRTVDTAGDDVRRAFYIARHERLPVVLTAPYDLQEEDYPWDWDYEPSATLLVQTQAVHPDPVQVDYIAQRLAVAQRPVILAGRGSVLAGARNQLIELGKRTGALLATTLRAKGWFDGEEYDAGLAGAFSTPTSRELLGQADLVLGLGASLGHYTTEGGYLFPAAEVIQVDVAPHGMTQGVPVGHRRVRGDAAIVADALLTAFEGRQPAQGYRTDEVHQRLASGALREPPIDLAPGTLDPRAAFEAINAAVPDDAIVVVGAGHFWNFGVQYLTGRAPENYLFTALSFGAVGQGLGIAIGAAVAAPDRRVVLIEGDGSLLMNIQELEAVARHDIGLLSIVINDGAYGAEVHKLASMGVDGSESVFGAPDLAAIARAFGVDGDRIDADGGDIAASVGRLLDAGGGVVDVHVSHTVASAQYRRLLFGEAV